MSNYNYHSLVKEIYSDLERNKSSLLIFADTIVFIRTFDRIFFYNSIEVWFNIVQSKRISISRLSLYNCQDITYKHFKNIIKSIDYVHKRIRL